MDLLAGLHRRRDLVAVGYSAEELKRARRDGELSLVRRGTYLRGPVPSRDEARHGLLVHAATKDLVAEAVVSHVSAAVLHGLPVWNVPLGRVHVTRDRGHGGRSGTRAHVHVAPLAPDERCVVGGVAVTSVARTVVDLARTAGFEQAVVIADAALCRNQVTPFDLAAALRRAAGWPGIPTARRVVAFADAGGQSPGESRSRVAIARAGLPEPVLQWPVRSAGGDVVGFADFAWPQLRTVGEFDGRTKYGRLLRPGETPEEAVYREKLREDAFRAEDLWVARWIWPEIDPFRPVARRIRRGFRPP